MNDFMQQHSTARGREKYIAHTTATKAGSRSKASNILVLWCWEVGRMGPFVRRSGSEPTKRGRVCSQRAHLAACRSTSWRG